MCASVKHSLSMKRLAEEVVLVASIKELRELWLLPEGECLISVNGTQESM